VRPPHKWWNPVHVTLRAHRRLPSFRTQLLYAALEKVFRAASRGSFRLVEFSVQADHVHLIVEARDRVALSRGMRSLAIRAALALNAEMRRRRGKIWGDRYHRRELTTPRSVRNAIVYVLANYKKHFRVTHGRPRIDPCSSAPWFEGWTATRAPPDAPRPTARAETKLLATLWKRHGLVHPGESPRLPS
jgi:REP element-mobilizing transposase RayT